MSTLNQFTSLITQVVLILLGVVIFIIYLRWRHTAQHHNDAVVRESQRNFVSLFEAAPTGIIIINHKGEIVRLNEKAAVMFGYEPAELDGQQLERLLPERLRPVHRHHRESYFTAPQSRSMGVGLDLIGQRKNGVEFPIEVGLSYIESDEGLLAIGFVSDISKRKHLEDELRKLNAELEQRVRERTAHLTAVNEELEAFSYSVSHDLRAPLRAVDGFSQALLEDYHDILDEMGQDFLNRIRTESQRMGELIDDLISLSRYTRTEMNLKIVNLSSIVHTIVAELKAGEPDREVECSIQENITACADESLIRVVLQNLVNNAWKFTSKQPHAHIEFGCAEQQDTAAYYLRDNGAGFDMAYANKLFGAFQRLHSMDEFEGTGIGLATVQRIIHRHGGTVWAEGAVNKGATFYFTLAANGCRE